jgi:uncharacterized SAM-binding protein YcdF (DUF218 family)
MFFYLSKIFWFFASPGNVFLFALLLGLFLSGTRFKRIGKFCVSVAILFALTITFVPIGAYMTKTLEDRFPLPASLPERIDGIVVLGGVVDPVMSASRDTISIGGAAERVTVSAKLAHDHPEARLIFSGGSASIIRQDHKEADYVAELYGALGISADRLMLEREARNTWENAKYTMDMAAPRQGENWVLVTSAFHMPRAVGAFRRVGWELIPYPVDYGIAQSLSFPAPLSFSGGLNSITNAGHEWIGLIAYWLTGKNSAAFPKPRALESK